MYSEEKKNVLCKTEKTILLRNINVGFLGERDKTILMDKGLRYV